MLQPANYQPPSYEPKPGETQIPVFRGIVQESTPSSQIVCKELDRLANVNLVEQGWGRTSPEVTRINDRYKLTVARIGSLFKAVATGDATEEQDPAKVQSLRQELRAIAVYYEWTKQSDGGTRIRRLNQLFLSAY